MNKLFAWIDIPVTNMERAVKFYSAIVEKPLQIEEQGSRRTAMLYLEDGEVGGTLVQADGFQPGPQGPNVYSAAGATGDRHLKDHDGLCFGITKTRRRCIQHMTIRIEGVTS